MQVEHAWGSCPEEPGPPGEIAGQHELLSRLRAVAEAREAENAVLRAELDAERELRRRLELRLAEVPTYLCPEAVPRCGTGADHRARSDRSSPAVRTASSPIRAADPIHRSSACPKAAEQQSHSKSQRKQIPGHNQPR